MRRRLLATAIATALGTLSSVAQAVSLGDIHQKSRLSQPYSAVIDLHSVRLSDAYKIKAKLASPKIFKNAGISRFYHLTKLKFKTKIIGGKPVILVTSHNPIREPYLDFLIEANWPDGRMVKEYTVFLDPPSTIRQQASKPTFNASNYHSTAKPSSVNQNTTSSGSYQVQRSDTLWNIASRLKTPDTTTHQMMMALFDANPSAFERGNINNLKAGANLTVPQANTVANISPRVAASNFQKQLKEWRVKEASQAVQHNPDNRRTTSELAIESAPEETMMSGMSSSQNSANVELLKNKLLMMEEKAASEKMKVTELQSELESLKSQLSTTQRLLDLKNKQIAKLQNNEPIDLDEDAGMETPAPMDDSSSDTTESMETEVVTDTADTTAQIIDNEDSLDDAADKILNPDTSLDPDVALDPDAPLDDTSEEIANTDDTDEEPVSNETSMSESTETLVSEPTEITKESEYYDEVADVEDLSDESDGLLGDYTLPVVGGAGALGVGGLAWFLLGRRRRRNSYNTGDESILLPPDQASSLDESLLADSSESSLEDSSFLSEFSENDMTDIQEDTSEVDLLSETDVYIAYGRYEQAEELINQALEKKPDELPLLFKKLEIHYAARNTDEFDKTLSHLESLDADTQDQESWMRAMDMQTELSSVDTGYAGAAGAVAGGAAALAATSDTLVDDVDNLAKDEGLLNEISDFNDAMDVDLDLADLGTNETTGDESEFELDLGDESIDLDLTSSNSPDLGETPADDLDKTHVLGSSPVEDEVEQTLTMKANQTNDSTIDGLDQSLESLESMEESTFNLDPDLDNIDTSEMDFSLDDDDFSVSSLNELDSGLDQDLSQLSELNLDDLDLGDPNDDSILASIQLDDNESNAADKTPDANVELGSEVVDDDEIETKLDLANAYAEMGDEDGAKSIIEEVMEEGNDEQKTKAQAILQRLG